MQAGVMSFDSFFDEAGQYNEADEDEAQEADSTPRAFPPLSGQAADSINAKDLLDLEDESSDEENEMDWDDDDDAYDRWKSPALRHEGYGGYTSGDYAEPGPSLAGLLQDSMRTQFGEHHTQDHAIPLHEASEKDIDYAIKAALADVEDQALKDLSPFMPP